MKYFVFCSPFIAAYLMTHPESALAEDANIAHIGTSIESISFDLAHYNDNNQTAPLLNASVRTTNQVLNEPLPATQGEQSAEGPQLPPDIANASKIETSSTNRFKIPKDIKYIEMGFLAMNVADAALTIYCVEKGTCIEKNPLYGSRPSPLRVIAVKAALTSGQYILVREVAKESPAMARMVAITTLAAMTGVVGYNATVIF